MQPAYEMDLIKLVAVLAIVASTLIAGWTPLRKMHEASRIDRFARAEALAIGIFLGAGIIHMLGASAEGFIKAGIRYPLGELLAGIIVIFLLGLEHYGNSRAAASGANDRAVLAVLAALMLTFHSFLVGAALGTAGDIATTIVIVVAVGSHKGAAAFALAMTLVRSRMKRPMVVGLFLMFVFMFPLGVLAGAAAHAVTATHPLIQPIFGGLAAGTFIYLGTLHGLATGTLIDKCRHFPQFAMVVLGFAIMAVVAVFA